jgi:hypothetical protein
MSAGYVLLLVSFLGVVAFLTAWAVVRGGNRKVWPCMDTDHPCYECQLESIGT